MKVSPYKEFYEFTEYIPLPEIEDQFLRLKEVFECEIEIVRHSYKYEIGINYVNKPKYLILSEIKNVIRRLESMFPKLKIDLSDYKPPLNYGYSKVNGYKIYIQMITK